MKVTDFLYAIVIILGTTALIIVLTATLTLSEVLQYVSFSGARVYFAADLSQTDQKGAADAKVDELIKKLPYLGPAVQNGWLTIDRKAADNYSSYRDSIGANPKSSQFVGYQIQFSVPMLKIQIPLLGEVVTPPNGDNFSATVSSFLLREPTTDECLEQTRTSYRALMGLNPGYGKVSSSPGVRVRPDGFFPILDNGC